MDDNKKILLAEDDELLASLLSFRIQKAGYDVTVAKDGQEVKEYLSRNEPDLIVSDILMPYFSGLELTDFIRHGMKSQVPIIIISTAGHEENVLSAFELGANDFISKPVSPSELLVRIGRELNKQPG